MVAPAPGGDRRLLQRPQPRRRLAGVEDAGAGAGDRLDEAGGQGGDPGEVAEEVERGALGDQQRRAPARSPAAPRPAPPRATGPRRRACRRARPRTGASSPRPRRARRRRPACFLHDPRPGPRLGRHRRLGGHVAGADVLGERAGDDLLQRLAGIGHRASLDQRRAIALVTLRWPQTHPRRAISRSARPQRLIHEVTELPPFQILIDEHAGDVMAVLRGAVGRERRRGLLPGDLPLRPARLPEAAGRRQPARLADHDRPPQGDRPPPRQGPAAGPGGRGRARSRSSDPEPGDGDLGRGRRPAAEAAGRGDPALRQRPPPRRDRRRARLLARGGAPQPARGTQTTEKGARMKASLNRLAERASEEGLLDVAYTTTDSPFGTAAAGDDAARAWSASASRTRTPTSCWSTWRRGSPRACSRRPPSSTRRGASSTSTSRASSTDFDLPLDWQLSTGFRRRVLRAIARIPYGETRSYTRDGDQRRQRARGPRRRHRLRPQPDPARRPLPPRPAQRRRPRRLRRRPADEGGAAASSRACSTTESATG